MNLKHTLTSVVILFLSLAWIGIWGEASRVTDHNLQRGPILRKHSFQPPYLFGISSSIPYFEYGASTVATENFVRLVPAVKSRVGYIWNLEPLEVKNWQIILEFHIHNTISPGADGMALWYADQPKAVGSLFGYTDEFNGIGIIFDSYDNNEDGDVPGVYVIKNQGGNVNWSIDQDLKPQRLAACQSRFRNPINSFARAKITYENGFLSVALDLNANGEFSPCFSVQVDLPTGYFLGLTAATGGLADYHDVLSMVTSDIDADSESDSNVKQHFKHKKFDPLEYYNEHLKAMEAEKATAESIKDDGLLHKLVQENKQEAAVNNYNDSPEITTQPPIQQPPYQQPATQEPPLSPLPPQQPVQTTQIQCIDPAITKEDVRTLIHHVTNVVAQQERLQSLIENLERKISHELQSSIEDRIVDRKEVEHELRKLQQGMTGITSQLNNIQSLSSQVKDIFSQVSDLPNIVKKASSTFWIWATIIILIISWTFIFVKSRNAKYTKYL